jgi:hypothetical protein
MISARKQEDNKMEEYTEELLLESLNEEYEDDIDYDEGVDM